MSDNLFDRFDESSKGFIARVKRFGVEYFPYLMLIFNIGFEVVSRLFAIGFAIPFTPDFWGSLFINTMSSTLSYACFVFYAERKKRESETYIANLASWSKMSQTVRLNSFDRFIEYCREQYQRECEERREAIIANNTMISITRWRDKYSHLSDREIGALVKCGEISHAEARYIKKANRHPRLKPINPLLILAGMKVHDINDAGRSNTSPLAGIITRPIPVMLMSIAFSMFAGSFVGVADSSAIFDMIYTAGMIVCSSLIGYAKGVSNIDKRSLEIKSRIIFLEHFEKSI